MAVYGFGIGALWAILQGANPTPIRFGTVKKVSVEIKANTKKLTGQARVPVAIGVGETNITGTIEQAEFDANRFAQLFWGAPVSTGQTTAAMDEAQTVPSTGPYTIPVANASHYVQDLGVLDQTSGVLLSRVASGPATGQYSVNTTTGVYTFAAADASRPLFISYDYNIPLTGGNFTPLNPTMGVNPVFELRLTNPFQGTDKDLTLFNCVATSQKFDFSNEDFMIPNLDYEAFAGANSQFMKWSVSAAQTGSRQ